ncbi:MAG: hypothetical protein Q7S35_02260 [Candidatus Limnocylindrales bacterium]|nr:hypothetical protein [Candidatus Limnocylindrales bacterium]
MAKGRTGSGKGKGTKDAFIDAMTQLVGDVKGAVDPLSKRAGKELRKLEKRLVAARATETKRRAQLTSAQGSKGRKQVGKRTKQAGDAAKEVAALAARIASLAASAAGSAAGTVGGRVSRAAREVGTAATQAVESVSPIKGPRLETPASKAAATAAIGGILAAKAGTSRRRPTGAKRATSKPATRRAATAAAGSAAAGSAAAPNAAKHTSAMAPKVATTREPAGMRKPAATTRKPAASTRKPATSRVTTSAPRQRPRPADGSAGDSST